MTARLELTRFTNKRSDAASLLVVSAHLALVLAPLFVAAALGVGWHLPLCWLAFGLLMNGLLNLMHETSHYHVFVSREANNRFGRWVLGPMALADFDAYRERHWNHHRRLGEPDDPKITYHTDIHGRRLFGLLLRCIFLREALARFSVQTADAKEDHDPPLLSRVWVARGLTMQAFLCAALLATACATHGDVNSAAIAAFVAYAGVYGYGLASVTVFAAALRGIAEHQIGADDAPTVGEAALRNFTSNPLSRLLMGAYGFAEHATHHREPAIPYYRLPAATRDLAAAEPALAPRHGYAGILWMLTTRRADSRDAGR